MKTAPIMIKGYNLNLPLLNFWKMPLAVNIPPLLKLDMPITKLVQPPMCCALPQQLLQGDVKTWKNYFTYGHGKFFGGDGASHLLCKPAVTSTFYIAVA